MNRLKVFATIISTLFLISAAQAEDASSAAEQIDTAVGSSEPQSVEPVAAPATMPTGSVARASFTSEIQDREPTDQIETLKSDSSTIYFFSELKDLQDQTVVHRWQHNGETMADISFNVGGPRWRVWSSKKLQDDWTGTWTVSVINGAGEIISSEQFKYEKAEVAETTAPPEGAIANTATKEEMKSEPATATE